MRTMRLSFEITEAMVYQSIKLVDNSYTEEMIIKGLNNGTIVTSTWHHGEQGGSLKLETIEGHVIGMITSQEIDGEYVNYK